MSDIVDRILKRREEEQQIKCPYCETIQPNDDYQYPVTYWGDEGAIDYECSECEKKFWVEEYVERSYTVGKYLDKLGCVTDEESKGDNATSEKDTTQSPSIQRQTIGHAKQGDCPQARHFRLSCL
jgi:DNA-directed RNA polymerase subunit RPC12/RpoP